MLLVLWDLDGTLLDAAPHGREAFVEAFERVVGHRPEEVPSMTGRTDPEIALELLTHNGVDDGERRLPDFLEAFAAAFADKEETLRSRGRILPGAREAIAALAREPGVVQSLLTGNIEPNAALKLRVLGLGDELDLGIGGYGSDHRDRPSLVAVARGKAARRYGEEVAPRDTVLVGDTPLDVAAARQAGARCVAVASGHADADELATAGPDALLADLRDLEVLLRAVLGPGAG